MDPQETVKLGYSSNQNISFRGWHDTGYTRTEWNNLTEEQRESVYTEAIWELVDLWEIPEGEDPDEATSKRW